MEATQPALREGEEESWGFWAAQNKCIGPAENWNPIWTCVSLCVLCLYVCVYLCCGKLTLTSFSSWWHQTKEEILSLLWFWVLSNLEHGGGYSNIELRFLVWFLYPEKFLCNLVVTYWTWKILFFDVLFFNFYNPLGNRILLPETTMNKFFGGIYYISWVYLWH